jgi:hypothetical protein
MAVLRQDSSQPTPSATLGGGSNAPEVIEIKVRPIERYIEDWKRALVHELTGTYPEISLLNDASGNRKPGYRESVFRLLSAAEAAPAAQKPAMLLAADFLLDPVWCDTEKQQECDELRSQFAAHKLTLAYSELGGGWYYQHDLLLRVVQDYPGTEWGQRAFVILLESAFDTSQTCAKGADRFRPVIQRGESFLEQYPNSSQRALVTHIVGAAYATWWSLSNPPTEEMRDYVKPKFYTEGSDHAREKAIEYFDRVVQLAPDGVLAEYSSQVLPALRDRKLTTDSYRFLCVYD